MKKIMIIMCLVCSINTVTANDKNNVSSENYSFTFFEHGFMSTGSYIVEAREETLSTVVSLLRDYNKNSNLTFQPQVNNSLGSMVNMTYVPSTNSSCSWKTFSYTISLSMAQRLRNMGSGEGIMTVCPNQARIINKAFNYADECNNQSSESQQFSSGSGSIVINNNIVIDDYQKPNSSRSGNSFPVNNRLDPWGGGSPGYQTVALAPLTGNLETDVQNIEFQEDEREYKLFFGAGRTKSAFVNIVEGVLRWAAIGALSYLIYDNLDFGGDNTPPNQNPDQDPTPGGGDYNPGNG